MLISSSNTKSSVQSSSPRAIKNSLQSSLSAYRSSTPIRTGPPADSIESASPREALTGPLVALHDLTELARSQGTIESFGLALTTARSDVRTRHAHLREAVRMTGGGASSDESMSNDVDILTWRLASALEVWIVDVEGAGRDVRDVENRLRDLIPADHGVTPAGLFSHLLDLAETWGPQSGQVTAPMLRAELERRGVSLSANPRDANALEALASTSGAVLDAIPTTFAGSLQLPRSELLDRLVGVLATSTATLLTGPAGVGKSSLAALALHRLREEGALIAAFSLAGRTGQRLADLESEVGAKLTTALREAPTGRSRILFIDGAEEALTDVGALLREILGTVPISGQDSPAWHVLVTVRDEAVDAVSAVITQASGNAPSQLLVDDLADTEIDEILGAFPVLQPLDRHERPRRLLRRPYTVDLLVRATTHDRLPQRVLGEEDVADLVVERLVRRGEGSVPGRGAPAARMDVFLAMADGVVSGAIPVRLDGTDPEARARMESDDVIRRIRVSYQLAHDVLADYAVATRLLEPDGSSVLLSTTSPRRLLRGVRLWMQHRLAHAPPTAVLGVWSEILGIANELTAADGPRWLDLPYEALLNVGRPDELLDALAPALLGDEGDSLAKLIDTAERLGRARTRTLESRSAAHVDPTLGAPIVGFLTRHAASIAERRWPAALSFTHKTLGALALSGFADSAQLIHEIDSLGDAIVAWMGLQPRRGQSDDGLIALALLAGHLTERSKAFLIESARDSPSQIDVVVEDPISSTVLARADPDLALRLAGVYYVNRDLTLEGGEDLSKSETHDVVPWRRLSFSEGPMGDEGIRGHSPRHFMRSGVGLAHPSLGPFAALLAASPRHGLRLIGSVVDAATRARIELEKELSISAEIVLDLQLPDWPAPRRYRGTGHVYLWYRRTSVGPYPAMSALMALRDWAIASATSGRPLRDVIEDILGAGDSLAFVAISYSVLVQWLDDTPPELGAFLSHPAIWHLEIQRVVAENSGLALPAPDSPRLRATPSYIAMELVLRSPAEQRQHLKEAGQALLATEDAESHGAITDDEMVVRRRGAAELDIEMYQAQAHDDQVQISVEYPEGVLRGLEASGGHAAQFLEISNLTFQACQVRDGQLDADPVAIWRRLQDLCADLSVEDVQTMGPQGPGDGLAAAAAAVIAAAAERGEAVAMEPPRGVPTAACRPPGSGACGDLE